MSYDTLLLNGEIWRRYGQLAQGAREVWLCSCGLAKQGPIDAVINALPPSRFIIGCSDKTDETRDQQRTMNAVRYAQRKWPRHQFRIATMVHFKFAIFHYNSGNTQAIAMMGSANLTSGFWDEVMIQAPEPVARELMLLFEEYWNRYTKVPPPHPEDILDKLAKGTSKSMPTGR